MPLILHSTRSMASSRINGVQGHGRHVWAYRLLTSAHSRADKGGKGDVVLWLLLATTLAAAGSAEDGGDVADSLTAGIAGTRAAHTAGAVVLQVAGPPTLHKCAARARTAASP